MKRAALSNTFSKGVLDPGLGERIDLEHFYNSLADALNIECFPQGGFRRRAGTTVMSRLRRRLQPIPLTAGMIAAPNGGTIASLLDQSETTFFTTTAASGSSFTILEVDLGRPRNVCFVDLIGFACASGRFPRAIAVEYLDARWTDSSDTWVELAQDPAYGRKGLSSGVATDTLTSISISSKAIDVKYAQFSAPADGVLSSMTVTLDGALAGSAATVTLAIDGVDVPGGVATIPVSGSGAGTAVTVTPSGGNAVDASQVITARVGGGSTATSTLKVSVTITEAQQTRNRRFGLAPGGSVTARRWRVVGYGIAGAGAVTLSGLRFWGEKRQLSPQIGRSFARAGSLVFELAIGDRNIDVFRDGVWQAAVPVDVDQAQVAELVYTQSLDTALLYHEDIQTVRVTRQGADDEWNGAPVRFANVPPLTGGTAFGGDQNEIHDVRLPGIAAGEAFVLWLGAKVTTEIVWGASVAADVTAALTAIGVPSGLTVTLLGSDGFRLTFAGSAGARRWPVTLATPIDVDDIEPATSVVQLGLDSHGPIFSDTTGWPRCGVVYQERHIVAGFRGAPLSYGVSRFGNAYDFTDDGDPLTADLAFFATLESDQLETIHQIAVSRHLIFFTETGEWYADFRTIDATQPFNVQLATRVGIRSSVPTAFCDGALVFAQGSGRILRSLIYSDVELSYTADSMTILSPHLVTGMVDIGYRQQRSDDEANHVLMVNDDGTIGFMALLRNQKVTAVTPWRTDGRFVRAFGDIRRRMWLITERSTAAGGAEHWLELLDDTHVLDAAVIYEGSGTTTLSVPHLAGKPVWALADGVLVGPLACPGGTLTLPAAASRVVAGLFPALHADLPKLREKLQNGYPWRPPARVYQVDLSLGEGGGLELSVNGGPFRPVPAASDAIVRMTGLRGFSRNPDIRLVQSRPEPLEVRAIRYEVSYG